MPGDGLEAAAAAVVLSQQLFLPKLKHHLLCFSFDRNVVSS
jgi:hypothetical protein